MQPTNRPARFRLKDDRAELARLKRLTGLDFESVPESLLHLVEAPQQPAMQGDSDAHGSASPLRRVEAPGRN